jgi:hypothetical protein
MVRSNVDYAGPLLADISNINKQTIESIQYHSMRHILNKPTGYSLTEMREELKLPTLEERNNELKIKYINKAFESNTLIKDLQSSHTEFKQLHNINSNDYTLFNNVKQ